MSTPESDHGGQNRRSIEKSFESYQVLYGSKIFINFLLIMFPGTIGAIGGLCFLGTASTTYLYFHRIVSLYFFGVWPSLVG